MHANTFTFVYCDTLMNVILFLNFSLNIFVNITRLKSV